MMEKTSSSPVAATPASMNTTPDKPKTASEHRKVRMEPPFRPEERGLNEESTHALMRQTRRLIPFTFFFSSVVKANYGKEEESPNQREFGPAENPHPGCAQKGCKYSLIAPVINRFAKSPRVRRGESECAVLTVCSSPSHQSSRHSKLEKADILEMTVKHLRNLQRAQMTGE